MPDNQFIDDTIKISEIVPFIADIAFPDECKTKDGRISARNRVRQRISDSAKRGELIISIKTNEKTANTKAFFSWAVTKWPELLSITSLPLEENIGSGNIEIPDLELDAVAVQIPVDRDELESSLIRVTTELHHANVIIERLKNRISLLEKEVSFWEAKDAERRKKSGRRGNN